MAIGGIVPAVIGAVFFVVREVVTSAGGADELPWLALTSGLKLTNVVQDREGHAGGGGNGAVVAGKRGGATGIEA